MAYGWQTDGGMAEYLLCKASSLVKMPDAVSYIDGAMLACGVSD
jgi:D-arabinose 1-dehydrogenase-like Zn-dependent alcohol dehydrogenase